MKNKNLIIFVDAYVLTGEHQGTSTYIRELYLEILNLNPSLKIIFGVKKINDVKRYFEKYKNVDYFVYKSKSSLSRIFFEIPKAINKFQCTHAHFQYIIPLNRKKSCKYITTIHDILYDDFPENFSFFYRFKRNILFYFSAKNCDKLLTVSKYSKERISKKFNINENEIIITPNGVSQNLMNFNKSKTFSKRYIYDKFSIKKYILYLSRIEPRKNQELLLRAFIKNKLYDKGYSVLLIGNDTFKTNFRDMVNNYNKKCSNSIYWLNNLELSELLLFINAAECFVYPSYAEGFGIPPLEAGCLSTPVLCSKNTAMSEFNFFEPHTFDPYNSNEFSNKLLTFMNSLDSIDLKKIKSNIIKRYSWNLSAKIFIKNVLND